MTHQSDYVKDKKYQAILDKDKETSIHFKKFLASIKRVQTAKNYIGCLDQIMQTLKIKSYSDFVALEPNKRQDMMEEYILNHHGSTKYLGNHISAFSKFLDMNRCVYWKAPLKGLLPANNGVKAGGRRYTDEEIRMMLDVCWDLRSRFIVLYFTNTGARPGSAEDQDGYLKLRDVKDMPENCSNITIYKNTSEEYEGFLTPEATAALKAYLTWREVTKKETLTDDSPLFANSNKCQSPYMTTKNVSRVLYSIAKKAGIKRTLVNGHKYDLAITYGFRKRLNTILKIDNEVNSNIAEKLMGHKRGLDGTYLKPTVEECFAEFRKVIGEITVNEEDKLKVENMKLKAEDTRVTREKVLAVFDLAESDVETFTKMMLQKRKDRKYK